MADFDAQREAKEFERNQKLLDVIHGLLRWGIVIVFAVAVVGVVVYAIHILTPARWLSEIELTKIENVGLGFLIAAFTMLLRRALDR